MDFHNDAESEAAASETCTVTRPPGAAAGARIAVRTAGSNRGIVSRPDVHFRDILQRIERRLPGTGGRADTAFGARLGESGCEA
jgi:hypothetical protein